MNEEKALKAMKETEELADRLIKVEAINKATLKHLKQLIDEVAKQSRRRGLGSKPLPQRMSSYELLLEKEKELKHQIRFHKGATYLGVPAAVFGVVFGSMLMEKTTGDPGVSIAIFGLAVSMTSFCAGVMILFSHNSRLEKDQKKLKETQTELLLDS